MKILKPTLNVFGAAAALFLASTGAYAEYTGLTINSWTRVYDIKGNSIGGLAGRFCAKAFFKSGRSDEVCEDIATNTKGELFLVQTAKSWQGTDRPIHYSVTFEVGGVRYAGNVSNSWDANCTDYGREWRKQADLPAYYDTVCDQAVHFEFDLPVSRKCAARTRGDVAQEICTLASNGLVPLMSSPAANDERLAVEESGSAKSRIAAPEDSAHGADSSRQVAL